MKKHNVKRHEVVQPLDTSYRYITLTQNKVAVVDAEYYGWLSMWNWCAMRSRRTFYAASESSGKLIKMHQLILPGTLPDHIDRDGLNNRKNNLRPSTLAQNCANSGIDGTNHSGFKGVSKQKNRWKAKITAQCKEHYLGLFLTAEDAARAYDEMAKKLHGEFAHLNFPATFSHPSS